jgi:hypothetical protein
MAEETQKKQLEENEKVKDTLLEKGFKMRFGIFPISVKPLTLAQVQEIGALAGGLGTNDDELKEMQFADGLSDLAKYGDLINDICLIILFRSQSKRGLLGGFIKKRLTSDHYKKLMGWLYQTFDFGFFLTSLVFMRGIKTKTKDGKKEEPNG